MFFFFKKDVCNILNKKYLFLIAFFKKEGHTKSNF